MRHDSRTGPGRRRQHRERTFISRVPSGCGTGRGSSPGQRDAHRLWRRRAAAPRSSTCTAAPRPPASTRSSPTATSRPTGSTRSSATCSRATPTASASSSSGASPPRTTHGPARHGRHLDGRVRRGRVDPRAHRHRAGTQATKDTLQPTIDTAVWKDKLYGIPKHTNVQLLWYRKSLVPTAPKTWDDVIAAEQEAEVRGQALRHRDHRGAVRGLRRGLQHDPVLGRRHAGQRQQHRGDRRRQDRARR